MASKQRFLFFLLLAIGVPQIWAERLHPDDDEIRESCPMHLRVNLTGETGNDTTGIVVKWGYVFSSTWKTESGDIFSCKCSSRIPTCAPFYCPVGTSMYRKVIRDCKKDHYNPSDNPFVYSLSDNRKIFVNESAFWMRQGSKNCKWLGGDVRVADKNSNGVLRDGDFHLRKNGSVYSPQMNISSMYNFESYCLCDDVQFRTYKPNCNEGKDSPDGANGGQCLGLNQRWFADFFLKIFIAMGMTSCYL